MAQRIVQVRLPKSAHASLEELLADEAVVTWWREGGSDQRVNLQYLLAAEETESLLDSLEQKFGSAEGFRVIITPVEASLPRPPPQPSPEPVHEAVPAPRRLFRVSREELLSEIEEGIRLNRVYLALIVLSSIVAAVGLARDNVAVIIGAMVIAPLLGPNMGAALATTLGDLNMIQRSARTLASGAALALALGTLMGFALPVDLGSTELQARAGTIHPYDLVLALASGAAGALCFTTGAGTALIGVMVAVALLPPLTASGVFLGAGRPQAAGSALLLFLANLICVNLSAVGTFLLQGIRPRTWWEGRQAKRMTQRALALWIGLLMILSLLLFFGQVDPTN